MVTVNEFRKQFPLTLLEAAYSVSIAWHGWLTIDPELPAPTARGAKPFLCFCGGSDTAARTTFSRARKSGALRFYQDVSGTERYDMPPIGQDLNRFYRMPPAETEGITLAVFRFSSGQDIKRYILKEILKNFGFRMLTQNVYAAGAIPAEPLESAVEREGLTEHLFLFPQNGYPPDNTLKRIAEVFKAEEWSRRAEAFTEGLKTFLPETVDDRESYHRALYAAAASHQHLKVQIPPLPERVLPGKARFDEAERLITDYFITHWEGHRAVHQSLHGGAQ